MNSIQEDIAAAMASQGPARDKFIENLESYVKSIQDSTQSQVESKLQQSITQRNALVERLDQLREHQRAYFRAVKSLQGVMRENETLQR